MGCDIHVYGERRNTNGIWNALGPFETEDVDYGTGSPPRLHVYQEYKKGPYSGRNYALFSYLADVRGYDDCPAWDQPRNIPDDCSDTVKTIVDQWDCDGHSHSWYSLAELDEIRKVAMLENGNTNHYCGEFFRSVFSFFDAYRQPEDSDEDLRIVFFFDN